MTIHPRALKAISKIGEVSIPRFNNLPSFSQANLLEHAHRMIDYMPAKDWQDLQTVLIILSYCPRFIIYFLLKIIQLNRFFPDFIGSLLRQLDLGFNGIVRTLYFSDLDKDGKIYSELKWKTQNSTIDEDIQMQNFIKNNDLNSQLQDLEQPTISLQERVLCLKNLKKIILHDKEKIMDEIQEATKKSRSDALLGDIFPLLDHLTYLIQNSEKKLAPHKVKTPLSMMGKSSWYSLEPLGTILIISPWNYPFYQAIAPISTSFITGNATIYKPSEYTPLQGLIEGLLEKAGITKNWFKVVYGNGEVAQKLIDSHPSKIFFTGSVATGKKILAQAAPLLIPVELELGGKDPMIVCGDVDLKRAAKGAIWGAATNSGQSCTSVEKLIIEKSIYESFKKILIEEANKITIGTDLDGSCDIGPMIHEAQVNIVAKHLEDALAKGAKQLTGFSWDKKSCTVPLIILENITSDMLLYSEETFGPLLPLYSFENDSEAIFYANDSEFGLSASVWSHDLKRAQKIASQIKTGNISINNVMLSEGNHYLPFGGTKKSGMGRFKSHFGLESFSNIKSYLQDKNSKKIEGHWYPYNPEKFKLMQEMTLGLYSKGMKNFFKFAINGIRLEGKAQKK